MNSINFVCESTIKIIILISQDVWPVLLSIHKCISEYKKWDELALVLLKIKSYKLFKGGKHYIPTNFKAVSDFISFHKFSKIKYKISYNTTYTGSHRLTAYNTKNLLQSPVSDRSVQHWIKFRLLSVKILRKLWWKWKYK